MIQNASYLSTYNASYHGLIQNLSYLSTYNATYHKWAYNQTNDTFTLYNSTWDNRVLIQLVNLSISGNNLSWLSTYNATYDAKTGSVWNSNATAIWNSTVTQVGIGVALPTSALNVSGSVGIAGNLNISNTLNVFGGANITGGLKVTNGLNVLTENVGIGTSVPQQKLHIEGNTIFEDPLTESIKLWNMTYTNATQNSYYGFNTYSVSGSGVASLILTDLSGTNQQAYLFADGGTTNNIFGVSTSVDSGSTWKPALTIIQSGNVGIGINSLNPSFMLNINTTTTNLNGGIIITNDKSAGTFKYLGLIQANSTYTQIPSWQNASIIEGTADGGLILSSYATAGSIKFQTNFRNEKMRITSAGNVGIGTTTPTFPLTVMNNVTAISIWASSNVSATGYITRTSVYDKTKGRALDLIKDSDGYKNADGSINHQAFYGFVSYDKIDYSKPEINLIDGNEEIIYPYNITEEGISLDDEINLLRQAVFEIKDCTAKSNSWEEYKLCIGGA